MGKEKPGFLTAKAISNRIKSKGLQKLRWFCQMCQKQCRDENGFKCHITSESHHRQMLLFDENSNHFLGNYTRIFMKGYLDVLRRQFGGKRTQANVIYQEYIKDKEHVHMNSTKFTTLTGFINCLHKMGICRVDQTDKGWFIEYVAKDPEQEHIDRKKRKLNKTLAEDDEQFFELIEKHLCKRPREDNAQSTSQPTELMKAADDDKIAFNFFKAEPRVSDVKEQKMPQEEAAAPTERLQYISSTVELKANANTAVDRTAAAKDDHRAQSSAPTDRPSKKLSTLEQMKLDNERDKDRQKRTRHWLHEGIVVRLVDESLPSTLRDRNVVVQTVENRFSAIVRTVDVPEGGGRGQKMRVQQEHVITVIPKPGEPVLIVNGAYRECRGRLISVDRKQFTGEIELTSGIHAGTRLPAISYDDFSKLHASPA